MKWENWFSIDWQQVVGISLSAVGFYIGLMMFTRLMGLRSFSKLSSHDFAMTVAIGSILASTVLSDTPSLLQGLCAVGALFVIQGLVSIIRRKIKPLKALIDNQPIILMAHGEYFWDNLKEANLSTSDVQQVLRKNSIKSKSEVFVVIMETTGDMSVIKNNDVTPDWSLFNDIRDSDLLIDATKNSMKKDTLNNA
ncbi:YetF domain-containing protein [Psychrobacter sp. FBL11]|uniref:YetF domain-containing protein n=1 Tax=Psychrobacter saeujeotis TaxID=3143436 RepID=A0ABU9XBG5_9GAMM|nr:YetF domain-containing protein [uncultured Psychrobacter sp.]